MQTKYQKATTSDGVRFELPTRDLGEAAQFGWILVIASAMATCFLVVWSAIWLFVGLGLVVNGQMFGLLVAAISLIGVFGLYHTLKFLTLGWYVVRNKTKCEVEVNSKYLLSNERLGLFTWKRRRELTKIERLTIESAYRKDQADKVIGLRDDTVTIRAYTAQGSSAQRSFLVAPGYEKDLIQPMLVEVSEAIDYRRRMSVAGIAPIEISTEVAEPPENLASKLARESSGLGNQDGELPVDVVYQRPVDSDIEVYDYAGTEAFKVPPMGIWKGSKGMLGFSIAWNLFISVFTGFAAFAAFSDGPPNQLGWLAVLGGCIFLSIFWAVGIGTAIATINAGRRSAMLGVADGQLFIERKGAFGTKWVELPVDEVEKVVVGPSGTSVNNVPIMELQIHKKNGRKHSLLSQLSNDDLSWIAQELRKSLV